MKKLLSFLICAALILSNSYRRIRRGGNKRQMRK